VWGLALGMTYRCIAAYLIQKVSMIAHAAGRAVRVVIVIGTRGVVQLTQTPSVQRKRIPALRLVKRCRLACIVRAPVAGVADARSPIAEAAYRSTLR